MLPSWMWASLLFPFKPSDTQWSFSMSIKISEFMTNNATLTEDTKKETKPSSASLKSKVVDEPLQTVHLSTQVQGIQQQIAQTPIVDMLKLRALKQRLQKTNMKLMLIAFLIRSCN